MMPKQREDLFEPDTAELGAEDKGRLQQLKKDIESGRYDVDRLWGQLLENMSFHMGEKACDADEE